MCVQARFPRCALYTLVYTALQIVLFTCMYTCGWVKTAVNLSLSLSFSYTYTHIRPGTFKLLAMGDPFTNELRFVVRIFTASHEQLQQFFNEKGELVGVGRLLVPWQPFDDKALDFLEKRYMSAYCVAGISCEEKFRQS